MFQSFSFLVEHFTEVLMLLYNAVVTLHPDLKRTSIELIVPDTVANTLYKLVY